VDDNTLDEKELLRAQIKAYEFYARLIDRAVGGGTQAKLPRWDEQRAEEYLELAEQLRRRLAELEAQEQAAAEATPATPPPTQPSAPESAQETAAAAPAPEGGVMVSSSDAEPVAQD
jgi:hypothetical protein